jgi:L-amino acid N-acyltransferase YncA
MIIRDAVEEDLPGILTIVNDVIAASTAIYRERPETPEERRAWLVERQSRGFPVLVAVDRTGVLGFSSYAGFRSAEGYRHSVEHSVHVRGPCARRHARAGRRHGSDACFVAPRAGE